MNQNHLRVNRSFMLMNAILAFALFAIVILFLYISFRFQRKADKQESFADVYVVTTDASLAGDSLSLFVNDSLIATRRVPIDGAADTVRRWTQQNVLMVVAHNDSDRVTPFALPDEAACITLGRSPEGGITLVP
jgi:hypothetical protein